MRFVPTKAQIMNVCSRTCVRVHAYQTRFCTFGTPQPTKRPSLLRHTFQQALARRVSLFLLRGMPKLAVLVTAWSHISWCTVDCNWPHCGQSGLLGRALCVV